MARMKKVTQLQLAPLMQVGPYDRADVISLQSVAAGVADEHQQRRAMEFIIYKLCDFDGVSFRDTDRETSFAEGKRFVAQAINAVLTYDSRKIEENYNE